MTKITAKNSQTSYYASMERIDPSLLREVSMSEVEQEIDFESIVAIDEFETNPIDAVGHNPIERILNEDYFPQSAIKKYTTSKLIGTLACNISLYNDELEDKIADDELIIAINHNRLTDQSNIDKYIIGLRVRRSVLAYLLDNSIDLIPVDFQKSQPENNLVNNQKPSTSVA